MMGPGDVGRGDVPESPYSDATLSEAEMNALVATIQSTTLTSSREVSADGRLRDVVKYDLVNARGAGEGRLPTLDIVHERFSGLVSEMLARITSVKVNVRPETAVILKFAEFGAALPNPYVMQVLELGGLRGAALLGIAPSLMFHLIDVLLGGAANKAVDASAILSQRGLTGVEKRLFAHIVRLLGTELAQAWDGVAAVSIRPVRAESEPKHAAIFEPSEMVVHAAFHVEMPGCQGEFRIIIPQSALRPVEKKLASGLVESGADNVEDWEGVIADILSEVPVQCTAELGHTQMSLGDLLRLQVGSVIRLDRDPESEITVFIEGAPKFTGSISVHVGNFAVNIGQQLSPREQGDGKAAPDSNARTGPATDTQTESRTNSDPNHAGAPGASGTTSRPSTHREVRS